MAGIAPPAVAPNLPAADGLNELRRPEAAPMPADVGPKPGEPRLLVPVGKSTGPPNVGPTLDAKPGGTPPVRNREVPLGTNVGGPRKPGATEGPKRLPKNGG